MSFPWKWWFSIVMLVYQRVNKRWLGNLSPVFGWQAFSGKYWNGWRAVVLSCCVAKIWPLSTQIVVIVITWLVVWNMFIFFHILGIIIPTDFHIFQSGRQKTTNQLHSVWICCLWKAHLIANIPWDVRGWMYNSDKSRGSGIGFNYSF